MSKLKIKTEWDLSPLLKSDDDPKAQEYIKEYETKAYEIINKWKERKDYLEDPKALKEALDEFEHFDSKYETAGKAGYYYWLRTNLDSENVDLKKIDAKIEEIIVKVSNDMAFFGIKLSKVSEDKQKEFLESKILEPYKHHLETLFENAKHILSEKEEQLLNLLGKPAAGDWIRMVSDFISKYEMTVIDADGIEKTVTQEEALKMASYDKNKKVRQSAEDALKTLFDDLEDVAEREINALLYTKKVTDNLRGFKSPNQARLLSDDIEPEVVSAMVEAVTERFDLSKRFYELKSKLLNIDKFEYFERGLRYGEVNKEYTFEEAVNLTYEVLNNIDQEFGNYVKEYAENGRFDAFPKKGKRGGGFCVHFSKELPVYVFLNHTNILRDVNTIAHEMGHAINNELMFKAQNALNADTPLSTAEVASTFFESFVQEKLLEDATDEEKLIILLEDLENEVATISRQTACYNFETELHNEFREKGFLSKEEIGEIFKKNMSAYMGERVNQEKMGHLSWIYWSHIRRFFYVYSYSSGLLIAKAMQQKYKEDKTFVEQVKTFLSAGTSKSPKEIFLSMGIDISKKEFWKEGLLDLENKLDKAEDLAKKLNKL